MKIRTFCFILAWGMSQMVFASSLSEPVGRGNGPQWIDGWLYEHFVGSETKRLSIVAINVDYFAKIKATFSPTQVNTIMERLAALADKVRKARLPETDSQLIRYSALGNNQDPLFLLTIKNASPETVIGLSEALREQVDLNTSLFEGIAVPQKARLRPEETYKIRHPINRKFFLTLSMGIASSDTSSQNPSAARQSINKLVDQALNALAESERRGRNQVALFEK